MVADGRAPGSSFPRHSEPARPRRRPAPGYRRIARVREPPGL